MAPPVTLISVSELAATRESWNDQRVALVPTMGALHEGHLSLVQAARRQADRVLVSIFVNPLQFGPNEDFAKYPRTLKSDLELLGSQGVEAVFLPNAASMYPDGYQTYVQNRSMATDLDGASRPGHFDGVLTVVLKLFNLVRPHVAIFGKKDYQQWRLIERMATDLCLPLAVQGAPICREADGLAMSSRNRYLSDTDRALAPRLYVALTAAKKVYDDGSRNPETIAEACRLVLADVQGLVLDYVQLRRQADLTTFAKVVDAPAVLLLAVRLGATRLIDNLEIG